MERRLLRASRTLVRYGVLFLRRKRWSGESKSENGDDREALNALRHGACRRKGDHKNLAYTAFVFHFPRLNNSELTIASSEKASVIAQNTPWGSIPGWVGGPRTGRYTFA